MPAPAIRSIERIDLTGSGDNTLILDRLAVLALTEARTDGVAIITVTGNGGDVVRFSEAQWAVVGSLEIDGIEYDRMLSADGTAEVRLAKGVTAAFPGGYTPNRFELATLNSTQGFIIIGDAANDRTGLRVSNAGDVNGDGFGDMLVGSSYAGEAYVVFGAAGGFGTRDTSGRQVIDLTTLTASQGFIVQDRALPRPGM